MVTSICLLAEAPILDRLPLRTKQKAGCRPCQLNMEEPQGTSLMRVLRIYIWKSLINLKQALFVDPYMSHFMPKPVKQQALGGKCTPLTTFKFT
jgi:hypothetical protein